MFCVTPVQAASGRSVSPLREASETLRACLSWEMCFKKSKEKEGWRRMYLSLEVACLCQAGGRNPGVRALGIAGPLLEYRGGGRPRRPLLESMRAEGWESGWRVGFFF